MIKTKKNKKLSNPEQLHRIVCVCNYASSLFFATKTFPYSLVLNSKLTIADLVQEKNCLRNPIPSIVLNLFFLSFMYPLFRKLITS